MKFFCWEKAMTGKFVPVVYSGQPERKTDGHNVKRQQIVELTSDIEDQPLKVLVRIYPLDRKAEPI